MGAVNARADAGAVVIAPRVRAPRAALSWRRPVRVRRVVIQHEPVVLDVPAAFPWWPVLATGLAGAITLAVFVIGVAVIL